MKTPLLTPRALGALVLTALVAGAVVARVTAHAAAGDTTADVALGQLKLTLNGRNLVDKRGLSSPTAVAIDVSVNPNRIYVVDAGNHRVMAWQSVDALTTGASAHLVLGQPDFISSTCNNGGISAKSLCSPSGVAVDSTGNLYVADTNNHRVLVFKQPFSTDTTADVVFGQGGLFTLAGCPYSPSANRLCYPTSVAVDSGGNVYVADSGYNRVLEYDKPLTLGTSADRVFGQGGSFTTNACNDFGPGAATLCNPVGVAVDSNGNVYVADFYNHRVLEYDKPMITNTIADRVFGQLGSFNSDVCNNGGTSADSLCEPRGVGVDGGGNVFIADTANNRVLAYYTPLTTNTTADRVFGQPTFIATTCPPGTENAKSLCWPAGVAIDGFRNLYIADVSNHRVLKYVQPLSSSPSATAADVALGQFFFDRNGDNLTTAQGLLLPSGVALDKSVMPNRVYVADQSNHRILAWHNADALLTGAPADLVIGQPDFFSQDAYDGGVSAKTLCLPKGLAVDAAGDLYVADFCNNRVLKYVSPFTTDTVADRVFGQSDFVSVSSAGCFGPTTTADTLCQPRGVAVDEAGNLYVADAIANRVLEYDAFTDATADRVFGTCGSFGMTACGGLSAESLYSPMAVALDSAGNLYVADGFNSRVLEYDSPLIDAVADRVFGQGGSFTSNFCNNGGVTADSLCLPTGLALDSSGTLYVTDAANNRVLEFQSPLVSSTATRVFGQAGSFTANVNNNGGVSADSLASPEGGVAVDSAGSVYVVDTNNNRVLKYDSSS